MKKLWIIAAVAVVIFTQCKNETKKTDPLTIVQERLDKMEQLHIVVTHRRNMLSDLGEKTREQEYLEKGFYADHSKNIEKIEMYDSIRVLLRSSYNYFYGLTMPPRMPNLIDADSMHQVLELVMELTDCVPSEGIIISGGSNKTPVQKMQYELGKLQYMEADISDRIDLTVAFKITPLDGNGNIVPLPISGSAENITKGRKMLKQIKRAQEYFAEREPVSAADLDSIFNLNLYFWEQAESISRISIDLGAGSEGRQI